MVLHLEKQQLNFYFEFPNISKNLVAFKLIFLMTTVRSLFKNKSI